MAIAPYFGGVMARAHPLAMLRAVAFAFSTLLCAAAVSAQSARPTGHGTYGVMAGANFAKLSGGDVQDAKTRTGLMVGGYAAWPIAESWSFQPELLYSMQGAKGSDEFGETTLKLDYLGVPLLFRFSPPTTSTTKPFVAIGPAFGYQVACNVSASSSQFSVNSSCDDAAQGTDFERKKFDFSGRIEAGADVAAGGTHVRIGGGYSHGFTDVVNHSKAKNRVFSVFLGIGL